MIKVGSIMWGSHVSTLVQASKELDFVQLELRSMRDLEDELVQEKFLEYLRQEADVLLLYPSANEVWSEMLPEIEKIRKAVPTVSFGHDPSFWSLSTVDPETVATAYKYLVTDGLENMKSLLSYIAREVLDIEMEVEPLKETPWQGIYHPNASSHFDNPEDYLKWHKKFDPSCPTAGILFYRSYWINGNLEVENALIRAFEDRKINVVPVFSHGFKENELGAKGNDVAIPALLTRDGEPIVDILLNLQSFFLVTLPEGSDVGCAEAGVELLKKLDVPVIDPLVSYRKTEEEWRADVQGLAENIVWSVAMPEFDGIIEPLVIGVQTRASDEETGVTLERYMPIPERVNHIVERAKKWIRLRRKPPQERKVVFVLHNNPCAGVEATVGSGANLDTLESVAKTMQKMKEQGYKVEKNPSEGKKLIETIMERKAISEFRWTPVEEIVAKGGAHTLLPLEKYLVWWNKLPENVREKMVSTWGEPPGEGMVHEGKIVLTGVEYGNVMVCVQPKRGCYGARCDGQVCKILHDPDCPPTHQYLATYRYLEDIWGADAVVHVGTHGNLEFLPGKAVGLSDSCYPDIGIGTLPHLYIYNADNPPEGTIAKRRSYATLIDHMQTVMTESGLYESLKELEGYLAEYNQAKISNPAHAHALEHLIVDKIKESKLEKEIGIEEKDIHGEESLDKTVKRAHEVLTRLRETQIQDGMHIFGELPQSDARVEFINSILRYDSDEEFSFRKTIFELMDLNYNYALNNPAEYYDDFGKTYGELLEEAQGYSKEFIREFLAHEEEVN